MSDQEFLDRAAIAAMQGELAHRAGFFDGNDFLASWAYECAFDLLEERRKRMLEDLEGQK